MRLHPPLLALAAILACCLPPPAQSYYYQPQEANETPAATTTTTPTNSTSERGAAGEKVKLGVYSESLCPDTKRFFVRQLLPTFRELNSIFDVDIVPFGHARTYGGGKMICQHGPRECEGNRRTACILSRSKSQSESVETISCIFKGEESIKTCINNNLKSSTYDDIESCTKADESYQMMVEAEKRTGRIGYVPHLKVNGEWTDDIQDQAENELKKFLCAKYAGQAPSACQSAT